MDVIPTGLFRQLTHSIRSMPTDPMEAVHQLPAIEPSVALAPVGGRHAQPLAPELLAEREAYLSVFRLLTQVYDVLQDETLGDRWLFELAERAAGPLITVHDILTGPLAHTSFADTLPARLIQALQHRTPEAPSPWSLGLLMDDRLGLTATETSMGSTMIRRSLDEARHGQQGLASALVGLAAEAWGNALCPGNAQVGRSWHALSRVRWAEAQLQERARLFGVIARRMRNQGLRLHDLDPGS